MNSLYQHGCRYVQAVEAGQPYFCNRETVGGTEYCQCHFYWAIVEQIEELKDSHHSNQQATRDKFDQIVPRIEALEALKSVVDAANNTVFQGSTWVVNSSSAAPSTIPVTGTWQTVTLNTGEPGTYHTIDINEARYRELKAMIAELDRYRVNDAQLVADLDEETNDRLDALEQGAEHSITRKILYRLTDLEKKVAGKIEWTTLRELLDVLQHHADKIADLEKQVAMRESTVKVYRGLLDDHFLRLNDQDEKIAAIERKLADRKNVAEFTSPSGIKLTYYDVSPQELHELDLKLQAQKQPTPAPAAERCTKPHVDFSAPEHTFVGQYVPVATYKAKVPVETADFANIKWEKQPTTPAPQQEPMKSDHAKGCTFEGKDWSYTHAGTCEEWMAKSRKLGLLATEIEAEPDTKYPTWEFEAVYSDPCGKNIAPITPGEIVDILSANIPSPSYIHTEVRNGRLVNIDAIAAAINKRMGLVKVPNPDQQVL